MVVVKTVDERIDRLLEEAVRNDQRALISILGQYGDVQVKTIYEMLYKRRVMPGGRHVLWMYKDSIDSATHGLSTDKRKARRQATRAAKSGFIDPTTADSFLKWKGAVQPLYVRYRDSDVILGQTFDICVLSDCFAITPNILCRAIETVKGGGVVLMLWPKSGDIEKIHSWCQGLSGKRSANGQGGVMLDIELDTHDQLRSSSAIIKKQEVSHRYLNRFFHVLRDVDSSLWVDSELSVLERLSKSHKRLGKLVKRGYDEQKQSPQGKVDSGITEALPDRTVVGVRRRKHLVQQRIEMKKALGDEEELQTSLLELSVTKNQMSLVKEAVDMLRTRSINIVASIMAARGRGKTAALGIVAGAALHLGYSNVIVGAPTAMNVQTLFEMARKTLEYMGYHQGNHYEVRSTSLSSSGNELPAGCIISKHEANRKVVVELLLSKDSKGGPIPRQRISYCRPVDPDDSSKCHPDFSRADLLLIDECAAIPLPIVRSLLELKSLAILSSTVYGYEGTGRALSTKLLAQIDGKNVPQRLRFRDHRKLTLDEPIRYSEGCPIERFLSDLFCLDAVDAPPVAKTDQPRPREQCQLYQVNRDILFSGADESERWLREKIMSLLISSHYKNSPNDMALLADAGSHSLFVFMESPEVLTDGTEPFVYAVIQTALEGAVPIDVVRQNTAQGKAEAGNLIPWLVSQQFNEEGFPSLIGLRIVRVARHPTYTGQKYGEKAIECLLNFLKMNNDGPLQSENEWEPPSLYRPVDKCIGSWYPGVQIDWVGAAFGLTDQLHRFWKTFNFFPVYVKNGQNKSTGEHSAIYIYRLMKSATFDSIDMGEADTSNWLAWFNWTFRRRFVVWLGGRNNNLPVELAQLVLGPFPSELRHQPLGALPVVTEANFHEYFSPAMVRRLASYNRGRVGSINDMLPSLANLYFEKRLWADVMPVEQAVLLGIGVQRKSAFQVVMELRRVAVAGGNISEDVIRNHLESVLRKLAGAILKLQDDKLKKKTAL